jgi:[ribosomal protein S5]-alanine N-acetyltransferase
MIIMRTNSESHIALDIPAYIETENLYLRPYRSGDGPMLYAAGMRNQEHLAEFESGNLLLFLKSEAQTEEIIDNLTADRAAHKCFFIGIFEKASNQWVGQVYVEPTNRDLPEFAIGYVADVNYEGKGFISEAVRSVLRMLFIDMRAHRIKSDCHEHNIRSWRLLERCGFKREGHLRENKRNADGSFHGDYLYGLLQQEYEQNLAAEAEPKGNNRIIAM